MKADPRRLPQLLRGLKDLRVICLYGDDGDAIRDCARHLVTAEAGSVDDPFRVTECDGDDRQAAAALGSPPLSGGRSVVWVRHAGERMLPLVEQALERDGVLVVVEYGGSTAKSRLRGTVERHPHGCVLGCYMQAERTREAIRAVLTELAVDADAGVVEALAAQADRQDCSGRAVGVAAGLFAGQGGRLGLGDVAALAGVGSAESLDGALHAGLRGGIEELDSTVTALLADGTAGIALLRSALFQVQRLRAMAILVAEGRSAAEAGRAMRPPVFFRQEQDTAAIVARWQADGLGRAAEVLWDAERQSKVTGVPQDAVCRESLARLARSAASRPKDRRGATSG